MDLDLIKELFLPSYEGFLLVDSKSQIILISNPSIENMLGYTSQELRGMHFNQIIPQNGLFLRMMDLVGEEETNKRKKIYWQMKKKDGSLINIDFVISLLSLPDENNQKFLSIYVEDRSTLSNLEIRINLIQSIFQAIREIKIAIEQEDPIDEIMKVACNSLQKARRFQIVWGIIQSEPEPTRLIFSDNPKSPDFAILASDFFEQNEELIPIREIFHSEQNSLFSYSNESSKYKSWCNFINPGGIINALCIPIAWNSITYGAIEIISFGENAFIEDDISMLSEVGIDIGFAIHSRISEEERVLALKQLGYQVQLLDAIEIPIFSLNQKGFINYANQTGLSFIQRNFSQAVNCELGDFLGFNEQQKQSLLTESLRIEILFHPENEQSKPSLIQSFIINDDKENFLGVMVIIFSLAEIKKAELQVRKSEANLKTIFATMNNGIVIVDREGLIIDIAPIFKFLLFQINPIEKGEFVFSFLEESTQIEFLELVRQTSSFQAIQTREFAFSMLGEEHFFSVRFMPMREYSQNQNTVLLLFTEITESKNMNRQLIESMKFASLGEIAAGIAHEINNPLQSALLILDELIHEEIADPLERKSFLKKVESANLRIRDLVKSLLDLGRIESPKKDFVSPYFILVRTTELMELSCKKKGIIYARNAEPNLPGIYVRWQEIEQVLINCIVNAVNALSEMNPKRDMPEVKVSIGLQKYANRQWVLFSIEDNGPGMDEETQKKAFLPLFTTRREKQGTGLGLAISKKIISDHDGLIEIRSKTNEGTRIDIYLPSTETDANSISSR